MTAKANQQFDGEQLHLMQQRLVAFIRHLVPMGFHIDVNTQVFAQQLLAANDFSEKAHLQQSLRTLLCKNPQQWQSFNQIYADFWLRKAKMAIVKRPTQPAKKAKQSVKDGKSDDSGAGTPRATQSKSAGTATKALADQASAKDVDEQVDFAFLDDEEMLNSFAQSCQHLAKQLSRRLRKTVKASKGERIDLRQSIQRNMKYGGNLVELVWLKKPKVLPQFTLLIDVSRSMSGYSNTFLIFALALVKEIPSTRVFIFNTKLLDISNTLRENRLQDIKLQLEMLSNTWGGGTRIAHSIAELRKRSVIGKRANHHFIIHSDGLDTDPAPALKQQLSLIQKQYRGIIWLSPLLRDAGYQVETAALKLALPHIDKLLPVHNLSCLYKLTDYLQNKSYGSRVGEAVHDK